MESLPIAALASRIACRNEPAPESDVVVTAKVAAVRSQHARVIIEHRRQEYADFMVVVLSERNHEPGQKKGREPNAPPIEGTSKRPCGEER